MKTYTYPAICERGESTFGAFFPDLPGCVTVGASMAELAEMAREALQLHLEGMLADGERPPEPTPPDQLEHDPEIDDVGVIFVSATPGPAEAVTLALSDTTLQRADETAQRLGQTRERVLSDGLERIFAAE